MPTDRRRTDRIVEIVREHFGLSELLCPSRSKTVAHARQVAIWIARQTLGLSYPELGRAFLRDHSTCISACRRIDRLLNEPDSYDAIVIRELLDRCSAERPGIARITTELDWLQSTTHAGAAE